MDKIIGMRLILAAGHSLLMMLIGTDLLSELRGIRKDLRAAKEDKEQ